MKRSVIVFALFGAFVLPIALLIPSCKEKEENTPVVFDPSAAKIENDIATDPIWIEMVDISKKYSDLIIAAPNLNKVITEDVRAFCNSVNITINEFNTDAIRMKKLSDDLMTKYNLHSIRGNCHLCNETSEKKLQRAHDNFEFLRNNPQEYTNFYEALRYTAKEGGETGTGSEGPECGVSFYLCCSVCAVSIEIFPVYLACCGVCMKEYCKNPPSWL